MISKGKNFSIFIVFVLKIKDRTVVYP